MANLNRFAGILLALSIIILSIVTLTMEQTSGFYVNNGPQQSAPVRYLTSQEKAALEQRILRLLGIPDRRKEEKPRMKRSAPKFLLNVYNDVQRKKWSNDGEFKLNERNIQDIDHSDVIVSFMAQQPHQGMGGKPDKVRRMWFDVSAVPVDDDIVMSAELRLYRDKIEGIKGETTYIVKVFRVFHDSDGNRDRHFVDAIKSTKSGWMALNVSECLKFWVQNPEENRGLYLEVSAPDAPKKIRPESIGIVGFKGPDEKQPFMVGFYKNSGKTNIQLNLNEILVRPVRSAFGNSLVELHDYTMEEPSSDWQGEECSLRTLYVNFRDIHWNDWIIAPTGFDAFFCAGECDHPLSHNVEATNHAIIQSLVHLKHPELVAKPCCVPASYHSLAVLYFQDQNNVVLKKFRDMIVRKCSCM